MQHEILRDSLHSAVINITAYTEQHTILHPGKA